MNTYKTENIKGVVLDVDDTLVNSSPYIQSEVERIWPQFSQNKLETLEFIRKLVEREKQDTEKLIAEARKTYSVPNLRDLGESQNDVIKTLDKVDDDFEYQYYEKPLVICNKACELAKYNCDMFLEERDATLEADGKLNKRKGLVDYDKIYDRSHVFNEVYKEVNSLYNILGSERLITLTAHNGIDDENGRETESKSELVHDINPDIVHYGLRFHATEHVPGKRRGRNSKARKIMNLYGLDNLKGFVLIDDSMANLDDWYIYGGTPIFVNRLGKSNEKGYGMIKNLNIDGFINLLEKLGYFTNNEEDILQKPRLIR